MQSIDLLISAKHILPVIPDNTVLEDHAIAINNGRIIAIKPRDKALTLYDAKSHSEFNQHIVMPGLINAHTHSALSLLRGIASDLPLMQWLEDHIWPIEQTWVDEKFVLDGSELAMAEMLRSGTTCFNDMYFFPEITAKAASSIGMRAVLGMILLEFPTRYAASTDEYFSKGLELYDAYKSDSLISTVFAPHAPYTVSDNTFNKLNAYANELDLPVHMHVHETKTEIENSIKEHGVRPLARLDKLGLVNPNLLAVHMTQLLPEEVARVAEAGATIVHCPESNLKLASGFCPSQQLIEHGAHVIVGTDSCASNDDLDMFSEMRTAALLAKGVSQDATAFSAQQAIRSVTIDAARALQLESEIGSLEPYKSADLIAISCDSVESQPMYDVHSHLVYSTDRSRVTDVFVAGKQLLRDRTLTVMSEEEIIIKAQAWKQKINAGK